MYKGGLSALIRYTVLETLQLAEIMNSNLISVCEFIKCQ